MLYICVFHSNRFKAEALACEGRNPADKSVCPKQKPRRSPKAWLFLFSNHPHHTFLAVKSKAKPAAITRHNVERLFVR